MPNPGRATASKQSSLRPPGIRERLDTATNVGIRRAERRSPTRRFRRRTGQCCRTGGRRSGGSVKTPAPQRGSDCQRRNPRARPWPAFHRGSAAVWHGYQKL